ncbi:rubredoxin [Cupriavidus plantarum]|nr:rubredoxin [Cupriavidus plantarum]RLK39397.1 rubredoxin [Cupriavidus plantarum]
MLQAFNVFVRLVRQWVRLSHAYSLIVWGRPQRFNRMYTKGTFLELQFSAQRLNDTAGEPYWIDLSREEARQLYEALQRRLEADLADTAAPLVVALDVIAEAPVQTKAETPRVAEAEFQQWVCLLCGWVYDEAEGLPEEGIPPGTKWADVPDDWRCPLCDVGKEDFAMVPL